MVAQGFTQRKKDRGGRRKARAGTIVARSSARFTARSTIFRGVIGFGSVALPQIPQSNGRLRQLPAWIAAVHLYQHVTHHRGQLTIYLRLWGEALYSTYGPTADTGGLPVNGARVIYRRGTVDDERLPVETDKPITERPDA